MELEVCVCILLGPAGLDQVPDISCILECTWVSAVDCVWSQVGFQSQPGPRTELRSGAGWSAGGGLNLERVQARRSVLVPELDGILELLCALQ